MNTTSIAPFEPLRRLLRFPPIQIAVMYFSLMFVHLAGIVFMQTFGQSPITRLASAIPIVANLLLVYCSLTYWLERRALQELALAKLGRELLIGLLLGFGLHSLCVLIAALLGVYQFGGLDSWSNLMPSAAAFSVPLFEELAFRGAIFLVLERVLGSWLALAISSLIFGLVHLANAGESLAGIASIVLIFGPMLAAPLMLTRCLWMGIGLHMAWNYTMGKVFSGAISGGEPAAGLFKITVQGPEYLTGGSAGMEGSWIAMIVCLLATLAMLSLTVRRGLIQPPSWRRQD